MHPTNSTLRHSPSSILAAVAITVLFGCTGYRGDPYAHLASAIDHIGKADAIMDQAAARPGPPTITKAEYKQRYEYYRTALKEARLIDPDSLNKDYPTLGDHCRNELKTGLEWTIRGDKKSDNRLAMSGQVLLAKFLEWYRSHEGEIKKPDNR